MRYFWIAYILSIQTFGIMAQQHENKVNDALYSSLRELGLTDGEARLYVASLSHGPSSITELARALGASRPNVYKLIYGLERHGLVRFSERKKYSKVFSVVSPTVVLEKVREKGMKLKRQDESIARALPDLLALHHQGRAPTSVQVFEGRDQFLKLFWQVLEEEDKESLFFGAVQNFIRFISWGEEKEWIVARMKKGIRIRALLLPSEDAYVLQKADKQEMRETRILKDMESFETSYQLFANKVIIWQPERPLAVLIEDEYIMRMLKSVFETLWERYREGEK